jgi:hypothetical protein
MPHGGTAIPAPEGEAGSEEAAMGSYFQDILKRLRRIEG